MRICLFAAVALMGLSVTAHAEPVSYLCIADFSTGFKLVGGKWTSVDFNVKDNRYIVKQVPEYDWLAEKVNYEVIPFGDTYPAFRCHRDSMVEQIGCGGLGMGFLMNFRTMRFQEVYGHGYLTGEDDGKNTPYLTIGKCAPL